MRRFFFAIGHKTLSAISQMGDIAIMLISALSWAFIPPLRIRNIFKQMEFIGVKSIFIVILTGLFTGGVLALQSYYAFRKFGGESLLGATVALSMTRELGPVLTALMVTGRAGSAIAAELGTMRVTEQIDALAVMAINPVKYLVVPRIIAGILVVPILTVIDDFVGIVGGYIIGVGLLKINPGIFMAKMIELVELSDIFNGLFKSVCFGLLLTLIGCYKGYHTRGGAEGVGRATTESVVVSSVSILVGDYILTSLLF
ncbi:MAG: ABC transporter permease [Thermodesulfobacteriota bacterium]|nr:ABC transporter permease [Desulfovibrionales bacterium]MDQ7837001.1 ABC transporter permease [Thermodesulfobacteriota bacterium]